MSSDPISREEELELLKTLLESHDFYFSYTLDLTNTLQRKLSPTYSKSVPLVKRVSFFLFRPVF
jgi:hypothetical protein